MVDEYSAECERHAPTKIVVNRFHGEDGNPNELGITRRGGILATGKTNERESGLDTFRGKELIRRVTKR